jgi:hypothetical protein
MGLNQYEKATEMLTLEVQTIEVTGCKMAEDIIAKQTYIA